MVYLDRGIVVSAWVRLDSSSSAKPQRILTVIPTAPTYLHTYLPLPTSTYLYLTERGSLYHVWEKTEKKLNTTNSPGNSFD